MILDLGSNTMPKRVKEMIGMPDNFKMGMIDREKVRQKYGCRCAYCGCSLIGKFHVDHIVPKHAGGTDDFENLNPACHRCNNRKNVLAIEEFRNEILKQTERLNRNSNQYRLAIDYGLIEETGNDVVFWFERTE